MKIVKVWKRNIIIPTYKIGKPNIEPAFLEKRVYQGSSGSVYPHHIIDKIEDIKYNKKYKALYLENNFIKIMILPELGGKIHEAYDKIAKRDFIYKNDVIKPALVGLAGPWVSGGIEFNWPQHHRPSTFDCVDWHIQKNNDGSASVIVGETEKMYRIRSSIKITLYPDKAYIEIKGNLYNGTSLPQNFLWWANPAIKANGNHQSIFPPDVNAVFDHGKRDVSEFPIAKGNYYKMDYSKGVDISRYNNIPVPTSYMAYKSKYDFVGAYVHDEKAGILHVANHNISPGKKQWTWGNGDFGKTWYSNLTDKNGPYIELMTGIYCDNQPDFAWLEPYEQKIFTQYFMPYRDMENVHNANKDFILKCVENEKNIDISLYSTSHFENLEMWIWINNKIYKKFKIEKINPEKIWKQIINISKSDIKIKLLNPSKKELFNYHNQIQFHKIPKASIAPKNPKNIKFIEELLLDGEFIEQYKYSTSDAKHYFIEALKRDPKNTQANLMMSKYLYKRGNFDESLKYINNGFERLLNKTNNPYNGELFYQKGLILKYQKKYTQAYDAFYKATWNGTLSSRSFLNIAIISFIKKKYEEAYDHIELAIKNNSFNNKAKIIKTIIARKLGRPILKIIKKEIINDPLFVSMIYEQYLNDTKHSTLSKFKKISRLSSVNVMETAQIYIDLNLCDDALKLLNIANINKDPMIGFYKIYCLLELKCNVKAKNIIKELDSMSLKPVFPNSLFDIKILEKSINTFDNELAKYLLGNLLYDKKQYNNAVNLWEQILKTKNKNYIVFRNLAIHYFNNAKDCDKSFKLMQKAITLSPNNARLLYEYNDLLVKISKTPEERIKAFENEYLIFQRDDITIEYIKLLNINKKFEKAHKIIKNRNFHPWEGGEGKITTEYMINNISLAANKINKKKYNDTIKLLEKNLKFPKNLGEGKLIISTDNDTYFLLGLCYKFLKNKTEATKMFNLATKGLGEVSSAIYYNDQPADYVMYQALAYKLLGNKKKFIKLSNKLNDYGIQHMNKELKIDFFAISLPDTSMFNNNWFNINKAHCCYVIALHYLVIENYKKFNNYIDKVIKIDPNNNKAYLMKNTIMPILKKTFS